MINKLKIFQKPDQTWIIFGHLGMLVLLLYSGIYYLERTLFIDTAYQLFNVMNFEQMFVSVGRYSDYIVKAPAWIAVESGASVKGVLMTFSIGNCCHLLPCFYSLHPPSQKPLCRNRSIAQFDRGHEAKFLSSNDGNTSSIGLLLFVLGMALFSNEKHR